MTIALRPLDTGLTALPPGPPTYDGFVFFVENTMAVPPEFMPTDATMQIAYDYALNLTYWGIATVPSQPTSPSIYALAVYNLGAAYLVMIAQDEADSTYWSDLRNKLGLNSFTYGMVNQASDQGTSEGLFIPAQIQNMTLMDLQLAKSPWGRAYLMIAGQWGTIWGITF